MNFSHSFKVINMAIFILIAIHTPCYRQYKKPLVWSAMNPTGMLNIKGRFNLAHNTLNVLIHPFGYWHTTCHNAPCSSSDVGPRTSEWLHGPGGADRKEQGSRAFGQVAGGLEHRKSRDFPTFHGDSRPAAALELSTRGKSSASVKPTPH